MGLNRIINSENLKKAGKAIAETPKRIKEDLSEIKLPLTEGIKAGKEAYEKTGSVGAAIGAGAEATVKQNIKNVEQIAKAATEGSVFSTAKAVKDAK